MNRRYKALYEAYLKALGRPDVHSHNEAIMAAINSPCSRYWISTTEAARQIKKIERGEKTKYTDGGHKDTILKHVYEVYLKLKKLPSFRGATTEFITAFAVVTPAPCFFTSFNRARKIIKAVQKRMDEDEEL